MDEILLVGAGGHARACVDVLELQNKYSVVGFVERNIAANSRDFGYPLLGTDGDLGDLRKKYNNALITIGQIKTPKIRIRIFELLKTLDYELPVIRSPLAYASNKSIVGDGTILMHGAIVNANASIGENCIINSNSLIEHDTRIGNHCHIATGALINGSVEIGFGSFIGSGATIKNGVKIGSNCIIGAGVILKHDIPSGQLIKL